MSVQVDEGRKIVVVEGHAMTFEFLECLIQPTADGLWFRFDEKPDGTLQLQSATEEKVTFTSSTVTFKQ